MVLGRFKVILWVGRHFTPTLTEDIWESKISKKSFFNFKQKMQIGKYS